MWGYALLFSRQLGTTWVPKLFKHIVESLLINLLPLFIFTCDLGHWHGLWQTCLAITFHSYLLVRVHKSLITWKYFHDKYMGHFHVPNHNNSFLSFNHLGHRHGSWQTCLAVTFHNYLLVKVHKKLMTPKFLSWQIHGSFWCARS